MDFRTILPIYEQDLKIEHQSGVCLIGSCFAEHIGQKLNEIKFKMLQSPFGILYNPFSIAKSLERIITNQPFEKSDLVEHNGLWVSFEHHSRYADLNASLALKKMNDSLNAAHHFLKDAKVLFISLGSAKIYRLKETEQVVANCHKFPAVSFDYALAGKKDIVTTLANAMEKLKDFNPQIHIIYTVSPVRHLKDGFLENQLSKSTLLLAVKALQRGNKNVNYFPSYELLLDDLRDYRFYESDMVHPNKLAIEYIFNYFNQIYFKGSTRVIIQQVQKINKAVNHRPFNLEGAQYQAHLNQTLKKIQDLKSKYPFIFFEKEEIALNNALL